MLVKILCEFLVIAICVLEVTECNHDEDTWIEPNAWSRDTPSWRLGKDLDGCPICSESATNTEDGVALLFYKKLIATLFKRERLQHEEVANVYQRSVHFTIFPAQVEKLEKLTDPRDLDSVLTEILRNARTFDFSGKSENNKRMGMYALILDIIKDIGHILKIFTETVKDLIHLSKISEVRFALLILSAILLCWFVHHRFHSGYIRIIVVGVLFYGYCITYLECNRKLEIDEMIEFINEGEPQVGWFSSVTSFFKKPNKNEAKIQNLKKSWELKLGMCRPDHVFIMYVNDLFLKQLEFLIEKCTETVSKLTNSLSFPFSWIAPVVLFMLIGYILKLTFKYILSPRAWASLWQYSREQKHTQQHSQLNTATSGVASLTEDRISGENLTLLLNVMKRPHIVVTGGNIDPQAVSGVEEVLEQIKQSSKSNSSDASLSEKPDASLSEKPDNESAGNSKTTKSIESLDKSKVTLE